MLKRKEVNPYTIDVNKLERLNVNSEVESNVTKR